VRNPEGKKQDGRTGRRWENIKIDFQKVGWGMHWIGLAQDRNKWRALVNRVTNLFVS
jgi:hypothetical protein